MSAEQNRGAEVQVQTGREAMMATVNGWNVLVLITTVS